MKAKALALCEVETKPVKHWRKDAGLMEYLKAL